jgi:23S rRNA (guanosine2251-2'-O)-methyltransferase
MRDADGSDGEVIFGRNPVVEALRSGLPLSRIMLGRETAGRPLEEIIELAARRGIEVLRVDRRTLDQATRGCVHQGVVGVGAPVPFATVESILAAAAGSAPLILVCDGITDPGNLGALIRSAEGAGCHGVILPARRSAGLSGTVAKASAGAVTHLPIAQVTNLTRTLEELKEKGLWIAGATMSATRLLWEQDLTGPLAVVVGGEGKGLSRLVEKTCDHLVRIPMRGQVSSLNVSVAGALLLYEVVRQRMAGGRPAESRLDDRSDDRELDGGSHGAGSCG